MLLFTLMAVAAPVAAQEVVPRTQPREHVVRRGDTLWDLARTYLLNPFSWPRIFEANRNVVEDPHWIYPDERLMIPGLEDTLGVSIRVEETPTVVSAGEGARSRFYRPPGGEVAEADPRSTFIAAEVEQPWAVAPHEYQSAPWLADTSSLDIIGQVTRLSDPRSLEDKLPSRMHPYELMYIGELRGSMPAVGDSLLLVGVAGSVNGYGDMVVPQALVEVVEFAGADVVARVVHQFGGAMVGHLAIPVPPIPALPRGAPTDVASGPAGQVLAFLDQDPLKANPDIGFVDLGASEVSPGDIMWAYLPAEIAGAEELESARIGRMKVIRTESGSATVRVLQVRNTGLVDGLTVRVKQRAQ